MLNTHELEKEINQLNDDLTNAKNAKKKKLIEQNIRKLRDRLTNIKAYEDINVNDIVFNGDRAKLGIVCEKEIQNTLPVIWVDWEGVKISTVATCLTVISKESLKWQWLNIDKEFKSLMAALGEKTRINLEEMILAEGCRDPLVIWKEYNILIDGHNRYSICKKHNLEFSVVQYSFDDRAQVINWIYKNQLGRRNLSQKQVKYYRGKLYNALKQEKGGIRQQLNNELSEGVSFRTIAIGQSVLKPQSTDTSLQIAQDHKVSAKTIRREGKMVEQAEAIAQTLDIEPLEVVERYSAKTIDRLATPPEKPKTSKLPKLEVNQLVKVNSDRTDERLIGHNLSYAVVTKIAGVSCDINIWNNAIANVHSQFLEPVESEKVTLKVCIDKAVLVKLMLFNESLEASLW